MISLFRFFYYSFSFSSVTCIHARRTYVWILFKATTSSSYWENREEALCICWQQPRLLSRICMYRRIRLERGRFLPFLVCPRRDATPPGTSNNGFAKGNISFYYCTPVARVRFYSGKMRYKCAKMSLNRLRMKTIASRYDHPRVVLGALCSRN